MDKLGMIEQIKDSLFSQVLMYLNDFKQFSGSSESSYFSPDEFYAVLNKDEYNFLVEVKNGKK